MNMSLWLKTMGLGLGWSVIGGMFGQGTSPTQTAWSLKPRTYDGTCNNLHRPEFGSAGLPLLRRTAVAYADGHSQPSGAERPNPREVSRFIQLQSVPIPNHDGASDFLWLWGQFLDHDISLTPPAEPREPFDIPVPMGDEEFDGTGSGTQVIRLDRSLWTERDSVRQQVNVVTAWIDASMVYGSSLERVRQLRAFDGSGRLQVTPTTVGDMLPYNVKGLPNQPTNKDGSFFVAGDVRANENVALTALHTLFVREHNAIVARLGRPLPNQREDERFEIARAIVGAEIQAITYKEYLPALLGPDALPPYQGYNSAIDPGIENAFSTVAFRIGHSQVAYKLQRRDSHGGDLGAVSLMDSFFNPALLAKGGLESFFRGLASQLAEEGDQKVNFYLQNTLFGPPGAGGMDLASINMQRARDHGLPSYNQLRVDYGLQPALGFADVTSNPTLQFRLGQKYASVDELDPWLGCLCEDHVPGAMVGALTRAILVEQFARLRDGDRYWYPRYLPSGHLAFVEQQTLASIIRRNTTIRSEIQEDVFRVP
jgi:hypothetical protein